MSFPALQNAMRAISALSRVPSVAASEASGEIRDLIEQQFASGTDPYGNAWEPLKQSTIERWGAHSILDLSGDMKDVDVKPLPGAGIAVTFGADYSQFHQTGTRNMPARPVLPTGALPDTWQRAIADAADNAFERTMAGVK